jgi:4'-phosphopantetheinyl transferase EntD
VLEQLLPAAAVVVSAREDVAGAKLYPEEEAAVGRAVEKRRREFVTARHCARQALARLGVTPQAIPIGKRGEPLWPEGIVGSITHCEGYRACALARSESLLTVGVDAEVDEPLPVGLLADIALPAEREWLRRLAGERPGTSWDRLIFSIKESVYKAWYPLARCWLGFEDAEVTIDPERRSFRARLLVPGPEVEGRRLGGFGGRWLARDGLLIAAIALPPGAASQAGKEVGLGGPIDED